MKNGHTFWERFFGWHDWEVKYTCPTNHAAEIHYRECKICHELSAIAKFSDGTTCRQDVGVRAREVLRKRPAEAINNEFIIRCSKE